MTEKKKRGKYEKPLAIKGTFEDVIQIALKDAGTDTKKTSKKVAKKK
jgi:hypothetical protein